ncbi:substrate-binding and VWA domain-containing protein [Streptomyces sp. NPDC004629]|uniref:substrate-binding and VWA domain-containing protein n=1 Tax=Streptomyces sp. NPDC004629 TaxID=3364705 RepID=UPI00367D1AE9
MGRHSLPDRSRAGAADPRPRARRRSVAIATVLVLTVAAGTAAAVRGGLLSFGPSCQDDPVRLTLAAAPDLAPALRAAAERAREEDVTSDGRCIALTVSAQDSSDVADTLRRGGKPDAQVWVPDSEVWVERVAADARATQVNQLGRVAATPVGVAMLPAAARSLGWPKKTYTWTELAGAALQSDSLRLGAADPARSATGLLALTRLGAAAAGTKNGQTQAAAMMKALAQRVSATDEQLLRTLPSDASGTAQDDPERNAALILSEQAAFAHNATADPGRRLDLFYPTDGSPSLDHPYALVDEAELTTDESRAAVRFMTYLRQPAQHRLLEKYGFRTDDDAVSRTLVDRAGGSTPQPYAEPSAEPPTGTALQQALGTWTITVQSARITTVVDASASMAEPVPGTARTRMDVTRSALLQALDTFTAEDEIRLWEFATRLDGDTDYRVLVPTERLGDGKGDGTQRARLSAAFGGLEPVPGGATGLYDTTLAAYRAATASYAKGRFNALVVLTDGVNEDPGSISRSALVAELEKLSDPERPVPLVVIAVGPEASRDEAARLAEATGGIAEMVDDPAQIHAVILKAIVAAGAAGAGRTAG